MHTARLRSLGITLLLVAGCAGHGGLFSKAKPEQESKLEHVTSATFDERVLKCDKPVLIDFYAEWCGPCKQLSPLVDEFASEHPEMRVVKVNFDENRDLAQRFQVSRLPTLVLVRGGQAASQSTGLITKDQIAKLAGVEPVKAVGATATVEETSPGRGKTMLR